MEVASVVVALFAAWVTWSTFSWPPPHSLLLALALAVVAVVLLLLAVRTPPHPPSLASFLLPAPSPLPPKTLAPLWQWRVWTPFSRAARAPWR